MWANLLFASRDPSLGPGCIPTNPQIVSAPEKQTLVVEPRAPSFAEAMPLSKNPSKIKTPTTSQIKPSRSGQNVTPSSKHDQTPSHSIRPPVSPGVTLVAPLTSTSNQGRDSTGRGVTTPSSSRGNTRTVAGPRNPKTTQKRKKDQKLQAD